MNTYNLVDSWRNKHPLDREYTWHRSSGAQALRIDMVWLPQNLLNSIQSIDIFPFFRSDHSCVLLKFNLPHSVDRGRGIWKLNSSLLNDQALRSKILNFWTEWQREKHLFTLPSS